MERSFCARYCPKCSAQLYKLGTFSPTILQKSKQKYREVNYLPNVTQLMKW